jgi:hypothetical protein
MTRLPGDSGALDRAPGQARGGRAFATVVGMACVAILVVIGMHMTQNLRSERPRVREFAPFYAVGRLLNEGQTETLYDFASFSRYFHEVFPDEPPDVRVPYSHAPFEAAVFRPFALFSYRVAFAMWIAFSLLLFCAGTVLVCRVSSAIPVGYWASVVPLAIAFFPVSIGCLAVGQVAAFGFFWIAVAVYWERRHWPFLAGLALAFCTSKPTLLILVVPMLVTTKRFRALVGLGAGSVALVGASVLVVGWSGYVSYVNMLWRFGRYATAASSPLNTAIYVDASAFVRLLLVGHGQAAVAAGLVTAAVAIPFLLRFWWCQRNSDDMALAWSGTIIWTMILSVYMPVYDTTTVAIAGVLLVDRLLGQGRSWEELPWRLKGLLYALYLTPWLGPPARVAGMQVNFYTVALAALAVYQLYLGRGAPNRGRGTSGEALAARQPT